MALRVLRATDVTGESSMEVHGAVPDRPLFAGNY
jgi:hypothetical protein